MCLPECRRRVRISPESSKISSILGARWLRARWRRLASTLASRRVFAPKRRVSRMATMSPVALVANNLTVNAIAWTTRIVRAREPQDASSIDKMRADELTIHQQVW